ncbi:MAG: hypothetical protein AAB885_02770 [Patescibacteria group bacterium]
MEQFIDNALKSFLGGRDAFLELFGPTLPWLMLIGVVISALFLWGIFYSISGSGWLPKRIEEYMDLFLIGDVGKKRQLRAWRKILKAAQSSNPTLWKQAVLQSDQVMDEIIKMAGHRGKTVVERFAQLPREALSNYDDIIAAHKVRDRVRQEADFALTQDETAQVLRVYEKSFKELGLLD